MKNGMENGGAFALPVVGIRLVKEGELMSEDSITMPEDAVKVLAKMMAELDRECIFTVNLDNKHRPISCSLVAMGGTASVQAGTPEIFKTAILSNASAVIMMHNHPSGIPEPSDEDAALTDRLNRVGALLGIPLLDHIVVGGNKYYSFLEHGIMPVYKPKYKKDPDAVNLAKAAEGVAEFE